MFLQIQIPDQSSPIPIDDKKVVKKCSSVVGSSLSTVLKVAGIQIYLFYSMYRFFLKYSAILAHKIAAYKPSFLMILSRTIMIGLIGGSNVFRTS
jgi:hypothetical protein